MADKSTAGELMVNLSAKPVFATLSFNELFIFIFLLLAEVLP